MLFCVFHTYIIRKDRCQAAGYERKKTSGDVGRIYRVGGAAGKAGNCEDPGEYKSSA